MHKVYNILIIFWLIILIFTLPIKTEELKEVITIPVGQSYLLNVKQVERVAITEPGIAEVVVVSAEEVLINGIEEGVTSLHLWLKEGYYKTILRIYSDYSFSAEQIRDIINNPDVKVIKLKDTVILKGIVKNQHEKKEANEIASSFAPRVIDLLKLKEPLQVLIRAYVVELNREGIEDLGLEWGGLVRGVFKPGQMLFGQLNTNTLPVQLDLLGVELEAMQKNNITRILANPELITLSGENSEILVGGEIPIIKSNEVIWKPYGIILSVNPEVLPGGEIQVVLAPEVSTVDWDNAIKVGDYQYPAFRTRRVKTQVIVEDGSTIVLGGLISQSDVQEVQKVPFLGDLPIFGELFQSHQFRNGGSELVVLIQTWVLNDELIEKFDLKDHNLLKGYKIWTEIKEVKPGEGHTER